MFHEPIGPDTKIHPAWCACSDCTIDAKRSLRTDLLVIALAVVAALTAVGAITLARYFGWMV